MKLRIFMSVLLVICGIANASPVKFSSNLEVAWTEALAGIRDAFPRQIEFNVYGRLQIKPILVEAGLGLAIVIIQDAPGTGMVYVTSGDTVRESGIGIPCFLGAGASIKLNKGLSLSATAGMMNIYYRALGKERSGMGYYGKMLLEWRREGNRKGYGVSLRFGQANTEGSVFPQEKGDHTFARVPAKTKDKWISLGFVFTRIYGKNY